MTTVASNQLYKRHLKYGRFDRLRYGLQETAFLAAQGTRLSASASAQNATVSGTVAAVKATGTLTNSGVNVTAADTVVIGAVTYTFQSSLTAGTANSVHVLRGASNTASMTNLFHAINNTGGTPGTDYNTTGTGAHPNVTATNPSGTTVVVTDTVFGTGGNSLATTATGIVNTWGHATLQNGVNAVTVKTFTATSNTFKEGDAVHFSTAPNDLTTTQDYVVHRTGSNTIQLALNVADIEAGAFIATGDATGGTFVLKRAVDSAGIYNLLYANTADMIRAATDIDNLQ